MNLRLCSLLAACLVASGCLIGHYEEGLPVPAERVARIVPGQTTKAEILDWFGPPQGLADGGLLDQYLVDRELKPGPVPDLPFADVLVYRLTQAHLRVMVFVLFNWAEWRTASDTLVVFFDANDRVLYFGYRRGTDVLH